MNDGLVEIVAVFDNVSLINDNLGPLYNGTGLAVD